MALAVALTGVSMVVAAGNGELKYRVKLGTEVHAAEIHQIGVEPIPATGQITIEDLLAVQGGETEDPRALEGCQIRRMSGRRSFRRGYDRR